MLPPGWSDSNLVPEAELEGAKACGFTTVMTTEIIGGFWPDQITGRKIFADYVIGSLDALL